MKKVIIVLSAFAMFTACSKTRINSNRFSGEVWKVVSISVDGEAEEQDHFQTFEFEDCDNFEEVCMGHWVIGAEDAHFAWQFNDNGETLTFSNQSEMDHEHDHDHEHDVDDDDHHHVNPIEQCQDFSGTYLVESSKRRSMKLSSTETIGYPGIEVVIELEHID
jgi:hypothetical protein